MTRLRNPAIVRLGALALAVLVGAGVSLPAEAQWKWRTPGGQMQYSDLPPPPGTADKDILQRPNTPQRAAAAAAPASQASAPTLSVRPVEPELEDKRRQADKEEAAKKKAEEQRLAAARAENCQRAQSALRSLEGGMRLARTNDKGEREILDDKQRADETQRARAVVSSDCGK
jgi:Domain of unknown function (DUF4124)